MGNQSVLQATLVEQSAITAHSTPVQLALFSADGSPFTPTTPAAYQANSVAADVPALVTDFNALLTKLKAAGLMEAS